MTSSRCQSARSRRRPAINLMALEPRMMFDGVASVAAHPAVDAAAHAMPDAAAQALIPVAPAPVMVRAADPSRDDGKKEAVFVDSSVPDVLALISGVRAGVEIDLIDGSQDGLAQIARWAETHSGYDAIHVLGHGAAGQQAIGTATLDLGDLGNGATQAELAMIGHSLKAGGDFLLWGCDVGQGSAGAVLTEQVAGLTGAVVGTSTDATGIDGNWTLERTTGAVDVDAPITEATRSSWNHDLSFPQVQGAISMTQGQSVAMDAAGNVYATGNYDAGVNFTTATGTISFAGAGIYVAKYNSSGYCVWADRFAVTNSNAAGRSVCLDASANVYITGSFTGNIEAIGKISLNPNGSNVISSTTGGSILAELDTNGNYVWAEVLPNIGTGNSAVLPFGYTVATDLTGNVYVAGYARNPSLYLTAFVEKFDNTGNQLWSELFTSSLTYSNSGFAINSMATDLSGNFYIGGAMSGNITDVVAGGPDAGRSDTFTTTGTIIAKFDQNGGRTWVDTYAAAAYSGAGSVTSIALDSSGHIYACGLAGLTSSTGGNNATATIGGGSYTYTTSATNSVALCLDNNGHFVWADNLFQNNQPIIGGVIPPTPYLYSLSITTDGLGNEYLAGVYSGAPVVVGSTTISLGASNTTATLIAKLDSSGSVLWGERLTSTSSIAESDIAANGLGAVVLTGQFMGTADFDPSTTTTLNITATGSGSGFVCAIDASGALDTNLNPPPVFTSGTTASISEFSDPSTTVYTAVAAYQTDPITYSLGGTNAALFNLDPTTGILTFKSAPSALTTYNVVITATDTADNKTAVQAVAVTVTAPTGPYVQTINRDADTPALTNRTTYDFDVIFSQAVSGVTAANFTLSGTRTGGQITNVTSTNGITWVVTVGTVTGDGTLGVNFSGATGITAVSGGAAAVGTHTADQTTTIDTTAPTLLLASCYPHNVTTGNTVATPIYLSFSETVLAGAVGNFYIYDVTNGVVLQTIARTSVSGWGTTSLYLPHQSLPTGRTIAIQWDAGVAKDATGNTVAANSSTTLYSFSTVNDITGTVSNGSLPVVIPSTATTLAGAVSAFSFTLNDGAGTDGQALNVSQIVLNTGGTGNFSWVNWVLPAAGAGGTDVTGVYNSSTGTLTFSGLSVSVANGGSSALTVKGYYNHNTGLTRGQTFIFSVNNAGITASSTGTGMAANGAAVYNGTGDTVGIAATQLVFTTQPAGTPTSGVAFATQPVVKAEDAVGNVDTSFTGTITLGTHTGSGAGTLGGTDSMSAVAGVATFTNVKFTSSVSDHEIISLDASATGLTTGTSNTSNVNVVATKLVFTTQPAPTVLIGGVATAFATVPVVQAEDAVGVVDTDYTGAVVLSVTKSGGATVPGTLNGLSGTGDTDGSATTVTRTAVSGGTSFAGLTLQYTTAGTTAETVALHAVSGSLTAAESSGIAEVNGPVVSPSNITLTGATGTNGKFRIGDSITASWDNSVNGDHDSGVQSVTFDFTQFGGAASVTASESNGVYTATSVITGLFNPSNILHVSVSATGTDGATTASDTSGAVVDNVMPTLVPASSTPADGATGQAVTIHPQLQFSEAVSLGAGGSFYIYDVTNGTVLQTIAYNSDAVTGWGTATLTILPSSNLLTGRDIAIRWDANVFQDAAGNLTPANGSNTLYDFTTVNDATGTVGAGTITVPVTLGSTVTTAGSAVSVFDFTLGDGAGTDGKTLTASQVVLHTSGSADFSKVVWALAEAGAGGSDVTGVYDGAAHTLTFSGLAISVANGDSAVYTVKGYYSDNTGLTKDQTYTLSLNNGDVSAGAAGTGMAANGTAVTVSDTVGVTATRLVFTTEPTAAPTSGFAFATQPGVTAEDAAGNVDTGFAGIVTLGVHSGSGAGTLGGTDSVGAVAGVATFTAVEFTSSASDHETLSLDATTGGLTTATSATQNVDVVATKLVFTTQPVPVTIPGGVATAFTSVPVVQAEDAVGVVDTDYAAPVALSVSNAAGGAAPGSVNALSGTGDTDASATTVTLTPTAGVASFTGLGVTYTTLGTPPDTIALHAVSGDLTAATSSAITAANNPIVSDARVSISGATGNGGVYKIGDTVTAIWDNSASGDDNALAIASVTIDFSQFGGSAAVTATSDGNGHWTASSTLVSGTIDRVENRNVSVSAAYAQANGGGTTTTEDTANAIVDNHAPNAPSSPSMMAASDTGWSNADGITSATTPTFTGTAEAGGSVKLYDGTTEIASTTADGSGNWSMVASTLGAGNHSIRARATDVAGNPAYPVDADTH